MKKTLFLSALGLIFLLVFLNLIPEIVCQYIISNIDVTIEGITNF
jgi:hypothetical protein